MADRFVVACDVIGHKTDIKYVSNLLPNTWTLSLIVCTELPQEKHLTLQVSVARTDSSI
ncbi:hypothetical protein BDZ91DRAFT_729986 [Kalaharituber pfeilii]|nr:hypothetical protein BDZ91DRAFT_729986 [Kalaharituber pfeilii]